MSPLVGEEYNADLAAAFGYPMVIVAVNELGTINATIQTLITAKFVLPQIPIAGIVLNRIALSPDDESTSWNAQELTRRASTLPCWPRSTTANSNSPPTSTGSPSPVQVTLSEICGEETANGR